MIFLAKTLSEDPEGRFTVEEMLEYDFAVPAVIQQRRFFSFKDDLVDHHIVHE